MHGGSQHIITASVWSETVSGYTRWGKHTDIMACTVTPLLDPQQCFAVGITHWCGFTPEQLGSVWTNNNGELEKIRCRDNAVTLCEKCHWGEILSIATKMDPNWTFLKNLLKIQSRQKGARCNNIIITYVEVTSEKLRHKQSNVIYDVQRIHNCTNLYIMETKKPLHKWMAQHSSRLCCPLTSAEKNNSFEDNVNILALRKAICWYPRKPPSCDQDVFFLYIYQIDRYTKTHWVGLQKMPIWNCWKEHHFLKFMQQRVLHT